MMSDNPWQVDNIQAFWFLKCPECTFDTKKENIFQEHAVENHPQSFVFFLDGIDTKVEIENDFFEIKQEPSIDFCESNNCIEINDDPLENEVALDYKTEQVFQNNECNQGIKEESSLTQHTVKVHKKKGKCKKENIKPENDIKEKLVHKKKEYPCSLCGKTFSITFNLKLHVESVHEGKKPFKCSKCEYRASRKAHLQYHVGSVHEGKKHLNALNVNTEPLKRLI